MVEFIINDVITLRVIRLVLLVGTKVANESKEWKELKVGSRLIYFASVTLKRGWEKKCFDAAVAMNGSITECVKARKL